MDTGEAKMWYTSKVFWLNLVAIVVAVGYYLMDTPGIVPATYVTYVAAGLGAANLVLRMVTNQPITLRGKKPDAPADVTDTPAANAPKD